MDVTENGIHTVPILNSYINGEQNTYCISLDYNQCLRPPCIIDYFFIIVGT